MFINEKHKNKVSEQFEYLYSYEKDEKLLDKNLIVNYKPYVRVKCKYCNKEIDKRLDQFKYGCQYCCNKYENSFAYYIEVELGENLDKYWDWELNNENPYFIYKGSSRNIIWIKCENKNYHRSYKTKCCDFSNGQRCPYCCSNKIHYFDSLGFLYHDIAKMIVEDERNGLTWEDIYKIATHSNEKYYFKCINCEQFNSNKKNINDVIRRNFSCEYCSDGISIPEKFMANVLNQLNIDFITQPGKKTFDWCKNYRYDFYIPSLNIIIETHGLQHYKNTKGSWKSLDEEKNNDNHKKELALSNGIEKYIIIDCRHSELEWLKNNIIKELKDIFILDNINWEYSYDNCLNSKITQAWNLWNQGFGVKYISIELNVSMSSVRNYLKRGNNFKMCNYTNEESRKRKYN